MLRSNPTTAKGTNCHAAGRAGARRFLSLCACASFSRRTAKQCFPSDDHPVGVCPESGNQTVRAKGASNEPSPFPAHRRERPHRCACGALTEQRARWCRKCHAPVRCAEGASRCTGYRLATCSPVDLPRTHCRGCWRVAHRCASIRDVSGRILTATDSGHGPGQSHSPTTEIINRSLLLGPPRRRLGHCRAARIWAATRRVLSGRWRYTSHLRPSDTRAQAVHLRARSTQLPLMRRLGRLPAPRSLRQQAGLPSLPRLVHSSKHDHDRSIAVAPHRLCQVLACRANRVGPGWELHGDRRTGAAVAGCEARCAVRSGWRTGLRRRCGRLCSRYAQLRR